VSVRLFCIGGSKDGQYVPVVERAFRCGSMEFAVTDDEPCTFPFDGESEPMSTFRMERYLVQQFMVNKRCLVFLAADDPVVSRDRIDDTTRRIIRHLAAMAGMDKPGIRRSFWLRHENGYLELAILAMQVASSVGSCINAVAFWNRAEECCARAGGRGGDDD